MYFTGTEIKEEMNRLYFGDKKLPFNSYNRLFSTHLSRLALHRFMHVVTVSIICYNLSLVLFLAQYSILQKKSFSVITAFLSPVVLFVFLYLIKLIPFFLGLYFLTILDWKGKPLSTPRFGVKGYNDFEHIRVESFRALDVVLWPRNKNKFTNTLAQDWLCPVVWWHDKPPFNLISCQTVTFFSAWVWGPGGIPPYITHIGGCRP